MKHPLLTSPINRTAGILGFFTSFLGFVNKKQNVGSEPHSYQYIVQEEKNGR